MRKYSFLFILLLLFTTACFSQKVYVTVYQLDKHTRAKSDTIYYEVNRKLTWDDFKGRPDLRNCGGAVTSSGFAFDADIKMDSRSIYLNVGVFTFFSKSGSWRKSNINSAYHLEHEQHHFDISRLCMENFIAEVMKARFDKSNYKTLLGEIFDRTYAVCDRMQNQYDMETQHSIKKEEQLRWNEIITAKINKLYSNSNHGLAVEDATLQSK